MLVLYGFAHVSLPQGNNLLRVLSTGRNRSRLNLKVFSDEIQIQNLGLLKCQGKRRHSPKTRCSVVHEVENTTLKKGVRKRKETSFALATVQPSGLESEVTGIGTKGTQKKKASKVVVVQSEDSSKLSSEEVTISSPKKRVSRKKSEAVLNGTDVEVNPMDINTSKLNAEEEVKTSTPKKCVGRKHKAESVAVLNGADVSLIISSTQGSDLESEFASGTKAGRNKKVSKAVVSESEDSSEINSEAASGTKAVRKKKVSKAVVSEAEDSSKINFEVASGTKAVRKKKVSKAVVSESEDSSKINSEVASRTKAVRKKKVSKTVVPESEDSSNLNPDEVTISRKTKSVLNGELSSVSITQRESSQLSMEDEKPQKTKRKKKDVVLESEGNDKEISALKPKARKKKQESQVPELESQSSPATDLMDSNSITIESPEEIKVEVDLSQSLEVTGENPDGIVPGSDIVAFEKQSKDGNQGTFQASLMERESPVDMIPSTTPLDQEVELVKKQYLEESVDVENKSLSDQLLFLEVQKKRIAAQEKRASISANKKKQFTPESELRFTMDHCSKFADVTGALATYDKYRGVIKFDQYNYNILLYLCSSAALGVLAPRKGSKQRPDYSENQGDGESKIPEEDGVEEDGVVFRGNMAGLVVRNVMGLSEEMMEMSLRRGLDIYERMLAEAVPPNEATFTALARLAVAKRDGDLAFAIVKEMTRANIAPKLRSYGPALYVYFKKNDVDKAFEVYNHMLAHGVQPEEVELEVLLQLSAKAGLEDKVYSVLHQLRETARDVSQSTVNVIERWFKGDFAAKATCQYSVGSDEVKAASSAKGGGWHGLGWLGKGQWKVEHSQLSRSGVCWNCKEQLVAIDIDPKETENFAKCVGALALKREQGNSFEAFKDWLDKHGPYDTVVDGANVGLYNQNFTGQMNFAQLNAVVSGIRRQSGKWPLIVMHNKRANTGPAKTFYAQQLLRQWKKENALYTAPTGSNDDWYWLYAAVHCKSLLVSNDEMRDHIFQLLGRDFFPKWKERHLVRFHVTNRGPYFHMPPPYSILIQESEIGSWHVPISGGDDISTPRRWLCVTRPQSHAQANLA